MRIEIHHGWLISIVGTARCIDGIWFAPICGEVEEPEQYPSYPLRENVEVRFDCEGFQLGDADGVWVRAAIPSVFGFAPLHVSDGRGFLLDAMFVAILPEGDGCWASYPFACTDLCEETMLVFSQLGPNSILRERIARAFWNLLLSEGAGRLSEFKASNVGFSTGDGYDSDLIVGYSRGEFFAEDMRESECESGAISFFDTHMVWLADVTRLCPDCCGSGEESFLPAGELCDTCGGVGFLG